MDIDALKEAYVRDGYVVVERFLPDDLVADLRAETERYVQAAREGRLIGPQFDIIETTAGPELRRITDPEAVSPVYDRAMRWDPLIDLVAELLDGTVRFDHGKLNFKPPSGGGALDWHQDYAFYPHTNADMLAVGLMIEDCTLENGPLMVIPGSHEGPIYDHHQGGFFVGGVKAEALGDLPGKAVALTAPAGSISIHHTAMLHASTANRGSKNRPLLLYNYFASDAFPLLATEDWEGFNAKLLRGEVVYQPRYAPLECKIPLPRPGGASQSIFHVQESLEGGAVLT